MLRPDTVGGLHVRLGDRGSFQNLDNAGALHCLLGIVDELCSQLLYCNLALPYEVLCLLVSCFLQLQNRAKSFLELLPKPAASQVMPSGVLGFEET